MSLPEKVSQHHQIEDLRAQVMAAELNLTYFAARHGKESPLYQESLKDFATAWYLLKKNRNSSEFLREVTAS
jgi:hypothetical protein